MFISCDWGTSAFRLRVIEGRDVLATLATGMGIAATHTAWQASALDERERVAFYRGILEKAIGELEGDLRGVPVVISGMASSSIGMLELPYHPLPFDLSGVGLQPAVLLPTMACPRTLFLVPGLRSADDVMRGEETQLIGCGVNGAGERVYVFPGTHSKHIRVRGTRVVDFKTYMTGEVFSLLARQSILAGSVAEPEGRLLGAELPEAFFAGVEAARGSGLLHNAFLTRTNQLFGKYGKEDNYFFLSGLLIGEELREVQRPITLVASSPLREAYLAALARLGVGQPTVIDADQALIAGHCAIIARFGATIAPN